ncbi:MAG: hypothetical protein IKY79_00275 [Bacteroidales bacterium]|nr:hypothetical protein [Bacteroidales bacterium]
MNEFVKTLNIEENFFEVTESCEIEYLIQCYAPCTLSGQYLIPAGTRFCLHGLMRGDAFYMHIIEDENTESLIKAMMDKEKNNYPKLAKEKRLAGFSFFITEEQLQTLPLKFLSGSKERSLEILMLIRKKR